MKKNDDGTFTITEQECDTILEFVQSTLWYVANCSRKPEAMMLDLSSRVNSPVIRSARSRIEDAARATVGIFGLTLKEPEPETPNVPQKKEATQCVHECERRGEGMRYVYERWQCRRKTNHKSGYCFEHRPLKYRDEAKPSKGAT